METPPTASLSRPLPRKDRMRLALEYQGNRRLRSLGTLLYRLTKGRIAPSGRDVLLLTTRGRVSGRAHTVLIQAFPDGANMVIAATNSGRPSDPDWFRNLEAKPTARVEIKGRMLPVRAEPLSPEESAAFWPRILRAAPSYARYREATGRAIPLVRLVPIGSEVGVLP
jgi:deazaflavin-dependent oxidoreductase (nitroreductase family)